MTDDAGMQQALEAANALVDSGNVSADQLIAIKQQLRAAADRLAQKPRVNMPDWGAIFPPELFGKDMTRAVATAQAITSQVAASDEHLHLARQFLVLVKTFHDLGGFAPSQVELPGPHSIRSDTK